jgi:hypothetical protein
MAHDRNRVTENNDRRAFLKQVGGVGAAAVLGATVGLEQIQAQQPRPETTPKEAAKAPPAAGKVPPVEVEKGKALVKQLQKDLNTNPALKQRYLDNPRAVMTERGFPTDLIGDVLTAHGFPVIFRPHHFLSCFITSCGTTIVIST